MHKGARACGALACALFGGCSVYDASLATPGARERRDAESLDAALDASDDLDRDEDVVVESLPPVEERAEDDRDAPSSLADADARIEDAGSADVADVADAPIENGSTARPTAVTLEGNASPSGQQAPTMSGSPFSQTCMPNEVVVGYTGTIDAPDAALQVLRTFRAVCGTSSVT